MCRESYPPILLKVFPTPPSLFNPLFNSLDGIFLAEFCTYILAKLLQNWEKVIQKLTPGLKNHMSNLDDFRQLVEVQKFEIQWTTFVKKIRFFSENIICRGFI